MESMQAIVPSCSCSIHFCVLVKHDAEKMLHPSGS